MKRFQKPGREVFIPQRCPAAGSEALSAYADGMLDGAELRQVDAHVAHCTDCAAALLELAQMRSALVTARDNARLPGEAYWSGIYRAARKQARLNHLAGSAQTDSGLRHAKPVRSAALIGAAVGFAAILLAFATPVSVRNGTAHRPAIQFGAAQARLAAARRASVAADDLSVNALVESHVRMVSMQASGDHARATYALSDLTARASGETAAAPVLQDTALQQAPEMGGRSVVLSD